MLSLHYYVFYNKKTSWQLKVFQKRPGFFSFPFAFTGKRLSGHKSSYAPSSVFEKSSIFFACRISGEQKDPAAMWLFEKVEIKCGNYFSEIPDKWKGICKLQGVLGKCKKALIMYAECEDFFGSIFCVCYPLLWVINTFGRVDTNLVMPRCQF